ncbi:hypothetical protein F441_08511 [Phytophthora nicotianae CJ01A1]|uniref:Uncharacterized protein n=3 Tax=Phytophthora nicotianae TaxID=4792 RepID=W2X3A7_PHYNI|nr:hypothetical protein L915_08366 [Phytophthora nicotianae]ETO75919.1 hypothetical protein F444_08600 [Phytophthora nicotianae P1976]ETP17012.1 hypothetical protein F441_08511 [Phytophthora nicotianae CJ01A1]
MEKTGGFFYFRLSLSYAAKRIGWEEIAHELRVYGRMIADLKARLLALKRTYSRELARFPPSLLPSKKQCISPS